MLFYALPDIFPYSNKGNPGDSVSLSKQHAPARRQLYSALPARSLSSLTQWPRSALCQHKLDSNKIKTASAQWEQRSASPPLSPRDGQRSYSSALVRCSIKVTEESLWSTDARVKWGFFPPLPSSPYSRKGLRGHQRRPGVNLLLSRHGNGRVKEKEGSEGNEKLQLDGWREERSSGADSGFFFYM